MEEEIIRWGAYIIVGLLGWMGAELKKDVNQHKQDLHDFKLHVVENYPKKDEMKELFQPVLRKLDKIEEYLLHAKERRDDGL